MEKLQNREQREEYKNKLTEMLENKKELLEKGEVEAKWETLRTAINEVADKMLGKTEHKERAQWYDEECLILIQERNEARKRTLQRKTRQAIEEYKEKRRITDKICRKKKRQFERRRIEELEEMKDRKEVRKFYERARDLRKGFQPRTVFTRIRMEISSETSKKCWKDGRSTSMSY